MLLMKGRMQPHTYLHYRLWEVDALRGFAIVIMVYYHFAFDLHYFGMQDLAWDGPIWNLQAKGIKSLFLFVVGVSLWLHYCNAQQKQISATRIFIMHAKRGFSIFLIGMLITLATTYMLSNGAIHFGILHAIGISIILASPLIRFGIWLALPGVTIIAAAILVHDRVIEGYWLLWLGVMMKGYNTVDYAPLIPNFGIVLLGIAGAAMLYPRAMRRYSLAQEPPGAVLGIVCWCGRHSLAIYLLHQIVLFSIFYALDFIGLIELRFQ